MVQVYITMPEKLILPDIGRLLGSQFLSINANFIDKYGEIDQLVAGFFPYRTLSAVRDSSIVRTM
jgi:hypothetical protein